MRHPNHGRVFYALLQANLPGWKRIAATLPRRRETEK
ncbi:hypothetical protein [Nibricoccus aquaticus]